MKRVLRIALPIVTVLFQFSPAEAAGVPGAIFTTTATGSVVNANLYTSKCDVYLNGGPGQNAPARAAGLPAGDYFFQVTDPNGQTLLSTDPVSNRRFRVSSAGVITAYTGAGGPAPHATGVSQDHPELGSITIALANTTCPTDYLDTPNNGGVYKVWVTPVGNFIGDVTKVDNACGGGCFHGFVPSTSKTDNFKVQPVTATFCLNVAKQIVASTGGTSPGFNWPILVTDPTGATNTYFTNATDGTLSLCGLTAGAYVVSEGFVLGYGEIALMVNNVSVNDPYTFTWAAGMAVPSIVFINQNFN